MTSKIVNVFVDLTDARSATLRRTAAHTRVMWLGALALCAMILGFGSQAVAETLSISAPGLVLRCPCGGSTDIAEESNGVFQAATPNGRYFVPVVFPVTSGQKVCSFSMAYQDVNEADTMTVRLLRKSYTVGGDPFAAPVAIATVKSAGRVVNTVRVASTTTIHSPAITAVRSFYYIEADIPTSNLNILGFQIDYGPTCP